jgi:hypothetical protein
MNRRASVLFATLVLAGAAPAMANTIYCCSDEHGRRSCGDTLPQACYGRAYREIVDGIPRDVSPSLTPEQKAKRDADARAKRDADRAALIERRRNQALLDSYASVDDIDYMRDRALAGIQRELKQGQQRYDELLKEKQQMAREAAAYKNGTVPDELSNKIRNNDKDIFDQQRLMDSKSQEMDDIRAKFEAEKQRYIELTKRPERTKGAPADAPR